MINKLYETIKGNLKQNFKFYLGLLILVFVFTIELPFYIEAPGGLIDVSKRIEIENSYEVEGSINLAYVLEIKATLPTLIWGVFDKNWDIYKKEEYISGNESVEEMSFRDHIMLEEANQNALLVGFEKANRYVSITNRKVYIIYVNETAQTDLKIGDQILKINDIEVDSKDDVYDLLSEYKAGDVVKFTVYNEGEKTKQAVLYEEADRVLVGMVLAETKDLDTNEEIKITFAKSESGPSGGFMMALATYNYLTEKDITNGLKLVGTGTIDENGNVGSIGGIEYKIKAAVKKKADLFFVPSGENYEDAKRVIAENDFDLKIIEISHIDEAISYLSQ